MFRGMTPEKGHYMRKHPTKGWQCWLRSIQVWCCVIDAPYSNDIVLSYDDTKSEPEQEPM